MGLKVAGTLSACVPSLTAAGGTQLDGSDDESEDDFDTPCHGGNGRGLKLARRDTVLPPPSMP